MSYTCPFCGKPKNRSGRGQSIIWIAIECITSGSALSRCDHCGQAFTIPAGIFANITFAEVKRVYQLPGDQLYDYVLETYVNPGNQHRMLKPDWYDILLNVNKAGPINTLTAQWNLPEKCPNCGRKPGASPIGFTYACPYCSVENSVAQGDIHKSLGVNVLCRNCQKPLHVPARVWCAKCRQNLLDYYDILRYIAEENGVPIETLEPK
jgi:hypothetical protein